MRRVLFNVVPYSGKIEDSRALNNRYSSQYRTVCVQFLEKKNNEIIQNK